MRNLIVGLDGSRSSEAALRQAMALADGVDARLHLLQAIEPTGPEHAIRLDEGHDPVDHLDRLEEARRGDEVLPIPEDDRLGESARMCEDYGLVCTSRKQHGMAARVLSERSLGMDILVIGRHGTVGRKSLGDTAAGVLRNPPVPTLLCRDEAVPWDRLLLCYEPTAEGGRALRLAGALASSLNVTLDLVGADQKRDKVREDLRYARDLLKSYHVEGEDYEHVGRLTEGIQSAALELQSCTVIVPQRRACLWRRPDTVRAAIDAPGAMTLIVP